MSGAPACRDGQLIRTSQVRADVHPPKPLTSRIEQALRGFVPAPLHLAQSEVLLQQKQYMRTASRYDRKTQPQNHLASCIADDACLESKLEYTEYTLSWHSDVYLLAG